MAGGAVAHNVCQSIVNAIGGNIYHMGICCVIILEREMQSTITGHAGLYIPQSFARMSFWYRAIFL